MKKQFCPAYGSKLLEGARSYPVFRYHIGQGQRALRHRFLQPITLTAAKGSFSSIIEWYRRRL